MKKNNMKATVFVKIQGLCGTGKTTIAHKLARALKAQGISTEVWEFDDSYQYGFADEEIDRNLKALSSKINVIIQTEQMNRHCV
jgi:adenylylsulfate kinase-like enzyme